MATTTEHPIVDNLLGGLDYQGLKDLVFPTFLKLVELDESAWRIRLKDDGFSEEQVAAMKSLISEWADGVDMEELSKRLMSVHDIDDEAEILRVLDTWSTDVSMGSRLADIAQTGFPVPLDAVCYAIGQMRTLTLATIKFEAMRRELAQQPRKNYSVMTPEQVAEGVTLAEAGLAEDAQAWPIY